MSAHFTYTYAQELAETAPAIKPTPLYKPQLQVVNKSFWQQLQLPDSWLEGNELVTQIFGEDTPLNKRSVAQKYGLRASPRAGFVTPWLDGSLFAAKSEY